MHLVRHPAGGATPGQPTFVVQGEQTNRIVVFDVDDGLIVGRGLPFFPGLARFFGQQVGGLHAQFAGVLLGTCAGQHYVRGVFHDLAREGDGVSDVLHKADRACILGVVHDARVERNVAIPVGKAADANAQSLGIRFHQPRSGFDHVQGISSSVECRKAFIIGQHAVVPRRSHGGSPAPFERFRQGRARPCLAPPTSNSEGAGNSRGFFDELSSR